MPEQPFPTFFLSGLAVLIGAVSFVDQGRLWGAAVFAVALAFHVRAGLELGLMETL